MRTLRSAKSKAFTLIELMIVVAIIGILAAVAVPAFMKYIRRSKTIEATMNLRKIYDSSVAYFYADHVTSDGQVLDHQFPTTNTWSPTTNCGTATGGKCNPASEAAAWRTATWVALNFSVEDPFYYSYQYSSTGTASTSSFSAEAQGDLDGDSTFSLFRRTGSITLDNNTVTGGPGVYSENDIE